MYQVQRPPSRARLWVSLAVVAAAAAVGTIITLVALTSDSGKTSSARENPFQLATEAPLKTASADCTTGTLADENKTLVIDMAGEDYSSGSATYSDIECVLDELGAPHSIMTKMGSTRALDGMQTARWSGYEATWTYHPDDGLDLILTQID